MPCRCDALQFDNGNGNIFPIAGIAKKSKKAAKKFNRYLDLYGLRLGLVCMKPVFDRRGSSDPRSLQLHSNPLTHRCTCTVPGL